MRRRILLLLLLPLSAGWGSCQKSGFLATNPNISLVLPNTIEACQALLDDDVVMNGFGDSGYPSLGVAGSDDYYCTDQQFGRYSLPDQQAATWASPMSPATGVNDWSLSYRVITTTVQVLQGLAPIKPRPDQQVRWNIAEGGAFFFRAFAYFSLSQVFCAPYDSDSASIEPGLPLRTSANISEKFTRSTLATTYSQILSDLAQAGPLLPSDSTWYPTRPSKAAVYGLLSRVYLSMRDYTKAFVYSDSCLRLRNQLMLYDTIPPMQSPPWSFQRFNPEVIFSAVYLSSGPSAPGRATVDSVLARSYVPNDLRSQLFFTKDGLFVGRYDEKGYGFCGLSVDEMLLTRAECFARAGNAPAAMDDLNRLLGTRWAAGTFIPYTAVDADDALQQVLTERRKELLFRGTRWTDLRRLNKESRWAIPLTRTVNGIPYTLPPGDRRYVYPIPGVVLADNPSMTQNLR